MEMARKQYGGPILNKKSESLTYQNQEYPGRNLRFWWKGRWGHGQNVGGMVWSQPGNEMKKS